MKQDQRSRKFVFVPFCLLCQAFQAQGIVRLGFSSVVGPIVKELMAHDLNIIQMPCPESRLGGYEAGLKREPRSIEKYDTEEFRKVCLKAAFSVVTMIKGILANDFKIVAILGIEYSPSCSVRLQYSNKGTTHRPGIFMEILMDLLKKEDIEIPFLGINRRGIKSSLEKLREVLDVQQELF